MHRSYRFPVGMLPKAKEHDPHLLQAISNGARPHHLVHW